MAEAVRWKETGLINDSRRDFPEHCPQDRTLGRKINIQRKGLGGFLFHTQDKNVG